MKHSLLGPDIETLRRWLAFLRIAVGVLYLYAFASKLGIGFIGHLPDQLSAFAAQNHFDFTRSLLRYFIAHPRIFGWMVLVGEFLAGVLLTVGLGTRIVAVVTLLLQFTYFLATLGGNIVVTLANGLFLVALLVITGTDGGWCWSLDRMIVNRK